MEGKEEKIIYKLDLDADTFIKTLNQVNERLGSLEKTSKKAEVPLLFANAAIAVKAFQKAVEIAGAAMDLVFEGEKIKAINAQFELLTKNAGLSGEALKKGLEEAANGLIDDTDLIETANKAIITMGASAAKLPAILELSRKATAGFGGDLKNNFDTFTQAISTGNVRMLKQYGIVVDSEKAIRDYAKSLGVTVSALTEIEKKQALSNAAIEQGKQKYKNINVNIRSSYDAWVQTKNAINEVVETIQILLSKSLGPGFTATFKSATQVIKDLTKSLHTMISPESDAQIKSYEDKIVSLKNRFSQLKTSGADTSFFTYLFGEKNAEKEMAEIEQEIMSMEGILDAAREKAGKKPKEDKTLDTAESTEENQRRIASRTKFEQDLLNLKKQRIEQELEVSKSQEETDKLIQEKYLALEQEKNIQLQQIDDQYRAGDIASVEQAEAMKLEIERNYQALRLELIENEKQVRMRALDNAVTQSKSTGEGISAAWKQASQKASDDLNNFGARGQRVFNSVASASKKAFIEMGEGSKTGSEIMKGFIFGMLADQAEAEGNLHLLKGIASLNPAEVAAGGALLALSGILRSKAGGASSAGVGSGPGGGAPSAFGGPEQAPQQFAQPKKAVTIQIQGSYFETEQTRQRLMEMIRTETDATDFKYVQVGGK